MLGNVFEKLIGVRANWAAGYVGGFAVVSEILGPFFRMCRKSVGDPPRVPGGKRGNADLGWLMHNTKQCEPAPKLWPTSAIRVGSTWYFAMVSGARIQARSAATS